jgi:Uma2 family endonuclease
VLQTPYTRSKVTVDVPLVVVEVKSPDDRFDDVMEKCFEYSKLGVAYILVFDPDHRRMYRFTADGNLTRTLEEQIVVETGEIPIVAERLFDMLAGE